jgi:hypothetical protein
MPTHKFKVGQTVRLSTAVMDRSFAGLYKVVALMPEERGDRQYRVQATGSPQQRVVWESQLTGVDLA